MTAWSVGACAGAVVALGVVAGYTVGWLPWPWLMGGPAWVIAGGLVGLYVSRAAR